MKKLVAVICLLAMALSLFAGCAPAAPGASDSTDSSAATKPSVKPGEKPEEVTLKILFRCDKPGGFDHILDEFYKRTRDTLNITLDFTFVSPPDYKDKLNLELTSGTEYDLVFDAPWILLRTLAAEGYYADLSEYFNNDNYPGLKKAFSKEVMESNKWFGKQCVIPLYRAFGNGIPAVHYRQDWADKWGIGKIDSYEKMEQYWDKAKAEGILPISVTGGRGYFQLYTVAWNRPDAAKKGIVNYTIGGVTYWVHVKDNKIAAMAVEGSGDENFKDFPEPFNYDFNADRFDKFAEYTQKGYISPDSMVSPDANTPFYAGKSASKIDVYDGIENDKREIAKFDPNAKIGHFVYDEAVRNMEKGAILTTFGANNCLAIPASSKHIPDTMRFFDWLFGSAENHNLFEYGIEGVDYKMTGKNTYDKLSDYNFPGFTFTWNPNYVMFPSILDEDEVAYREYELKGDTFQKAPLSDFSFDPTGDEVATAIAKVSAVMSKVNQVMVHGILEYEGVKYNSAEEMLKAYIDIAYENGADVIEEELTDQLNEYLKTAK